MEKLIRKALEEENKKRQLKAKPELTAQPDVPKNNASYLDSLGWVLFKEKKKYKEALGPLEEAVKDPDAQSIEIYDHLAEVQMATGSTDSRRRHLEKGAATAG